MLTTASSARRAADSCAGCSGGSRAPTISALNHPSWTTAQRLSTSRFGSRQRRTRRRRSRRSGSAISSRSRRPCCPPASCGGHLLEIPDTCPKWMPSTMGTCGCTWKPARPGHSEPIAASPSTCRPASSRRHGLARPGHRGRRNLLPRGQHRGSPHVGGGRSRSWAHGPLRTQIATALPDDRSSPSCGTTDGRARGDTDARGASLGRRPRLRRPPAPSPGPARVTASCLAWYGTGATRPPPAPEITDEAIGSPTTGLHTPTSGPPSEPRSSSSPRGSPAPTPRPPRRTTTLSVDPTRRPKAGVKPWPSRFSECDAEPVEIRDADRTRVLGLPCPCPGTPKSESGRS